MHVLSCIYIYIYTLVYVLYAPRCRDAWAHLVFQRIGYYEETLRKPWSTLVKRGHSRGLVRPEKESKKDIHEMDKFRHGLLSQWRSPISFKKNRGHGFDTMNKFEPFIGTRLICDLSRRLSWRERSWPFIDAEHKTILWNQQGSLICREWSWMI